MDVRIIRYLFNISSKNKQTNKNPHKQKITTKKKEKKEKKERQKTHNKQNSNKTNDDEDDDQ